jgi:hypothetical protein
VLGGIKIETYGKLVLTGMVNDIMLVILKIKLDLLLDEDDD